LTFTNFCRKIKYDIDTNTNRIGNLSTSWVQFYVQTRATFLRTYVET